MADDVQEVVAGLASRAREQMRALAQPEYDAGEYLMQCLEFVAVLGFLVV